MPRLLIDATPMSQHNKGVGRYAYQLCLQLSRRLSSHWEIAVLIHPGHPPAFPEDFRGRFLPVPQCSELKLGLYWRPYWVRNWQPDALVRTHDCVGLNPGIFNITICHDINALIIQAQGEQRTLFRKGLGFFKQSLRNYSLRCSDLVVCNSEFTQQAVSGYYGILPKKTALGYCGVDARFYKMAPLVDREKVLNKYGLDGYILTFATGDSRENFRLLPKIIDHLRSSGHLYPLLIAGVRPQHPSFRALNTEFSLLGLREGEHYFLESFLDESRFNDLVDLYTGADYYLELSLHEGFGMQLAEAMACGTTCLSTGCGSLSEVGGPFAIAIDPNDPEKIARTLIESYQNGRHLLLKAEQITFSHRYNWDSVGSVVSQRLENHINSNN